MSTSLTQTDSYPAWTAAWHALDLAPPTAVTKLAPASGRLTCSLDFAPLLLHWEMNIVGRSAANILCRFSNDAQRNGVDADALQLLAEGDPVRLHTSQGLSDAEFERVIEVRQPDGTQERHLLFRFALRDKNVAPHS